MRMDVLVVGAGLAGLSIAERLHRSGVDVALFEATERLGGRVLSPSIGGRRFDLGPAWFWPGQPRMAALVRRLGLSAFDQHAEGAIAFQDRSGAIHRDCGVGSMQGSYRLDGGMGALVDGLAETLPVERIRLGAPVVALALENGRVAARTPDAIVEASVVALAAPPRVIAGRIDFAPSPDAALAAMRRIPTWMAGQAKIVALYERPYWREAGFSGDAMSQIGPMVEIHDASPIAGGPYALFGFVGAPASVRLARAEALREAARAQLAAVFGEALADPIDLRLEDWAGAPFIATEADWAPPNGHPAYGPTPDLQGLWDGRLVFASSEMGRAFGGFLEGALEAADAAVEAIGARLTTAV